jgi:hypothetical protein
MSGMQNTLTWFVNYWQNMYVPGIYQIGEEDGRSQCSSRAACGRATRIGFPPHHAVKPQPIHWQRQRTGKNLLTVSWKLPIFSYGMHEMVRNPVFSLLITAHRERECGEECHEVGFAGRWEPYGRCQQRVQKLLHQWEPNWARGLCATGDHCIVPLHGIGSKLTHGLLPPRRWTRS